MQRLGEDSIWTVLAQFGNSINPTYGGTAGPQRNQIPQPDRIVDNSTILAPDFSQSYFHDLLFADTAGAVSMRNFYKELSANRYTVNGEVTDWGDVPFNEVYYGSNYCGGIVCARTWLFVRDSDAFYNNIGVTGPAFNKYGGVQVGGTNLWIGDYTVEPENGGVGVFSHEFGHDLGLPDLYDTSGNTGGAENPTGFWTLYSQGSYGNSGKPEDGLGTKPIHMSAYEKIFLNWSNYQVVRAGQSAFTRRLQHLFQHWVRVTVTGGRGVDRVYELRLACALDDVAEGAGGERRSHRWGVLVHTHDDGPGFGQDRQQLSRQRDAVGRWQGDLGEEHIGPQLQGQVKRLRAVRGFAHDRQARLEVEQHTQPSPHDCLVIGNDNADGVSVMLFRMVFLQLPSPVC